MKCMYSKNSSSNCIHYKHYSTVVLLASHIDYTLVYRHFEVLEEGTVWGPLSLKGGFQIFMYLVYMHRWMEHYLIYFHYNSQKLTY